MKKVLFIVNSLNNGGAERVCANMADEFVLKGYDVDIVTLGSSRSGNAYAKNPRVNYYSLGYKLTCASSRFACILFGAKKLSKFIKEREASGKYALITSHLPMSNLVSRFSRIKKRCVYVIHSNPKIISRRILGLLKKSKVACVSKGIAMELQSEYGFSKKSVRTIYNPIDISNIQRQSHDKVEASKPYFLVVGRFNELKRQDRAIDIFYKGNFYKKYDLVFCGTGELEDSIKKQVAGMDIKSHVRFLGWQDNIYKWIKNAELLLCTSDREGFPMNLIEAFACGTKVVSSNCAFGPDEILVGPYAKFLVNPGDVNGYIKKISIALKSYPKSKNPILEKCRASYCTEEYLKFAKEQL